MHSFVFTLTQQWSTTSLPLELPLLGNLRGEGKRYDGREKAGSSSMDAIMTKNQTQTLDDPGCAGLRMSS
jgi:hypothetical protein